MYTYLIGWRALDAWYYGVRTANTVDPEFDLWFHYFTSSKFVKEFRVTHGEPDVVRVHKKFDSREDAVAYEEKFIARVGAVGSNRWLNRGNAGKKFSNSTPWNIGIERSQTTKDKISQKLRGRIVPVEERLKISIAGRGRKQTTEHVLARKKSLKGRKPGFSGRTHSEETKHKMKLAKEKYWQDIKEKNAESSNPVA